MSEILKAYPDRSWWRRLILSNTSWWLILSCGHWYQWTGRTKPITGTIHCPVCSLPFVRGVS